MKNLLSTFKVLAALLLVLILTDSAYSQQVISSVNVGKNATTVAKSITNNSSSSEVVLENAENWMSHKNYLDVSSSYFKYLIMITMNEKVVESEKEIENWMLEESKWALPQSLSIDTPDEQKEIESWMLDELFWKIEPVSTVKAEDADERSIENWTTDDDFEQILN